MEMSFRPWREQVLGWPNTGRHILAQFDDETIIVYQAYCPAIGQYAISFGQFGGDFSYSRMSWIKPNFLWMMYRSGCGTKSDQEMTLGLRIRRPFFEALLSKAVPSSWDPETYRERVDWAVAVQDSSVRIQWDPDHHPSGAKLERRAVQLGLRSDSLEDFGRRELLDVVDLTGFVAEQRERMREGGIEALFTPKETVYLPSDPQLIQRLRLGNRSHQSASD